MRRLLAIVLLLLLPPGLASAQSLLGVEATSAPPVPAWQETRDAWLIPLQRAADGRLMMQPAQRIRVPEVLESGNHDQLLVLGSDRASSVNLATDKSSRLYSGIRLRSIEQATSRHGACDLLMADCIAGRQVWRGGSLLGGYRGDGVLLGLGLDWLQHNPEAGDTYLVVPVSEHSSFMGIPSQWIDSLNRIEANGSVQLGDGGTRLDVGASIGRVHLVTNRMASMAPGRARFFSSFGPVMDSIDQKALSIGLGKGAVSGTLVGRVMQPEGPGQLQRSQWSAVDLGITVRLPWEGELSLGAQNLWSSGDQDNLPNREVDPVQSRIPYIRYHQNL